MPVDRSIKAFKDENLNCAQSILRGFQEDHNINEDLITEFRKLGGGRAEAGLCGALHSALTLVDDNNAAETMKATFKDVAGSDKCREIRKLKQLTCQQCVELAAKLLKN
jgi:hypothetical protein